MSKLEAAGCSPAVVRLVVPTGYSFNLDGTSIYLTLAALFVAQALDVPLGAGDEAQLLLVLLLTSKGAAAVTGGGFVTRCDLRRLHEALPADHDDDDGGAVRCAAVGFDHRQRR